VWHSILLIQGEEDAKRKVNHAKNQRNIAIEMGVPVK
jgi:hypothetical protein